MATKELSRRRRTPRDESAYTSDEEDKPTRGRRRSKDDDDEKPARGRRASSSRDKDDEEDRPKRKRGKVSKGWGSYKKTAEATKTGGDWAPRYKPSDDVDLIKILDEGPFAVYKEHWIPRGKGKKQSFVCLKDEDDNGDCPLCDDLGDNPKAKAMVNVVNMIENPDKRQTEVWLIGALVGDILENAANESKTSPINDIDRYWSVEKIQKGRNISYQVHPVKGRDLEEDWDTEALTEDEIEDFEDAAFDDEEVYFNTVEELEEIVDEVSS